MSLTLTNKPYNRNILTGFSGSSVIEAYNNGNSWCRIWSDNWCEQGGVANATYTGTVVELLQEYKDSNYGGLAITRGVNTSATINTSFTPRTTNQASLSSGFTGAVATIWRAWGYIA